MATSDSENAPIRVRKAVTSLLDRVWKNGIIPYRIGQNVTGNYLLTMFCAGLLFVLPTKIFEFLVDLYILDA